MKTPDLTTLLGVTLLAAGLLSTVSVVAQAPAGGAGGGPGRMFFEHMDGDGDGKVTRAEFDEMHSVRFETVDGDKNGQVTLQEFIDGRPGPGPRTDRAEFMFSTLDANGDKLLTSDEFDAGAAKRFDVMDRNSDGVITADEVGPILGRGPGMGKGMGGGPGGGYGPGGPKGGPAQ